MCGLDIRHERLVETPANVERIYCNIPCHILGGIIPLLNMDSSSSATRSIEDLCAIAGQRHRDLPPLRPDLVPNFSEIRKVYLTFFASGLDHLLETGSSRWFAVKGFDLLTSDRSLLAQFMLYLTLISNTTPPSVCGAMTIEHAALASQECRMVWALLNLAVRQAQEGNDDDAERFARRVKSLEALLTSEPVVRTGSMSDFVYQDPEPEPDGDTDMEGIPTVANNPLLDKPFSKQMIARSDEFWSLIEKASGNPRSIQPEIIDRIRQLLDGREERDIIYAIMLLGSLQAQNQGQQPRSAGGSGTTTPALTNGKKERDVAMKLLETEGSGRATNMVLENLAGMGVRAFGQ